MAKSASAESFQKVIDSAEYRKLVSAVADGAIALIGAGVNVPLGYPSWPDLLDRLGEEAAIAAPGDAKVATAGAVSDFLVRAEIYSKAVGAGRRAEIISELYGRRPHVLTDVHRNIIRVPFKHFFTTNYDPVLEMSFEEVTGASAISFDLSDSAARADFASAMHKNAAKRQILHLHGSASRPEKTVLALKEYDQTYTLDAATTTILRTILAYRPLVFIGFSGADQHFMGLMNEWRAFLESSSPRHFAIMPSRGADDDSSRMILEARYGVTPIYFDTSEHYAALGLIIEKLAVDADNERKRCDAQELLPQLERVLTALFTGNAPMLAGAMGQLDQLATHAVGLTLAPTVISTASDANKTVLDQEIDEVHKLIHDGQPKVALAMFDKMLLKAATLSQREIYRLHANRGNALYSLGRTAEAAEAYLESRRHWESKDSRALEVLAHVLRSDFATASPLAQLLAADFPEFPRAYSLRLLAIDKSASLRDALRLVPRKMRREAEVAGALASIAAKRGRLREQEAYSRAVVKSSPEWAEGWVTLGTALFMRERTTARIAFGMGVVPRNAARLNEAIEAFTHALHMLKGDLQPGFRANALFNRSSVRRVLGDERGATDDLEAAYAIDPSRPEILSRVAWLKERAGNAEAAIAMLRGWKGSADPSIAFMLALILHERKGEGDLDMAATELLPWLGQFAALEDSPNPVELVRLLAEVYWAQGKKDKAIQLYLDCTDLPLAIRTANIARLEFVKGDPATIQKSKADIRLAVSELKEGADWFHIREVAYAAADVEDYATAATVLKQGIDASAWGADAESLVRWAYRAGDLKLILEFCGKLRAAGIFEKHAVSVEIDSLLRCDDPNLALKLMNEWLQKFPDDKIMRLNLSAVALRRGDVEMVEKELSRLPSVDELPSPEEGVTLIGVLQHSMPSGVLLRLAYDIWRKFSDSPVAQQTLMTTVLLRDKDGDHLNLPGVVNADSAVTIRMSDDQSTTLAIIEGGKLPRPTLNEYGTDHPVSKALLGKTVGATVRILDRDGVIEKIENKIWYRTSVCLRSFNQDFPNEHGFKRFHLPDIKSAGTDPRTALGPMWDILKAQEETQKHFVGLYQKGAVPISSLARAIGKTVIESIPSLASQQSFGIHVVDNAHGEWQQAEALFKDATAVVLDNSAVATLFLLGLDSRIRSLPFKCIVSETTVQEIRTLLQSQRPISGGAGSIAAEGERLRYTRHSPEQVVAWHHRLENLLSNLKSQCEIVGGSARLEFPTQLLDQFMESVGPAVVDSLAIAAQRGLPLWTDDRFIAATLADGMKRKRLWTQVVLENSKDAFTEDEITDSVTLLATWGYTFTKLSVYAIVRGLKKERWIFDTEQSKRLIQYVASVGALNAENCRVTQLLLVTIWRDCPRSKARPIICEILNRLPRSIAGTLIARPLYHPARSHRPWRTEPMWKAFRKLLRRWRMHRGPS